MRILTLTNLYPNSIQPHRAAFNRQQLAALARHHGVRVIAPVAWTDEFAARWRGSGNGCLERFERPDEGTAVEHPRYWFTPGLLRGTYGRSYLWSVRPAFERAVAEFQPDVVYAPWAYPDGWAAVRLGREAGVPVVVKVLGSDVLQLPRYPGRRRATVEALQQADRVVAVSRDLAERVVGLGISPAFIRVIYDGVNADLFNPGPRAAARARLGLAEETPVLLFVGNLLPVKAPDVLLDACERLTAQELDFACYLVGDGPLKPSLERRVRERGLSGRVTLCGALPHSRLPDWFRAASVVALPSYSEGVPNVLLEALACGTPFVASRVGGIPEIADSGVSRLVPPGCADSLARALRPFLTRPAADTPASETHTLRSWDDSATELAWLFEEAVRFSEPSTALTLANA